MIPVSPELAEAIEAPERHPLPRLIVHWDYDAAVPGPAQDLSEMVEAFTLDRSLAGDLPDEVSLVEGAASASLDVTLAVPSTLGIPASAYFHRLNPESPLYGKELLSAPVTLDMGFRTSTGPQYVRRFTGLTRSFRANSGARSARMTALDLREKLEWEWDLPQVGRRGYGLNAMWAMSSLLASRAWLTGYVAAPLPDGVFNGQYIPMHGSMHLLRGIEPVYTARVIESWTYPTSTTGASFFDRDTDPTFVPGPYIAGCYAGPKPVGRFRGNVLRGEFAYGQEFGPYGDYQTGRVEFWTRRRPPAFLEGTTAWKTAFVFGEFGEPVGLMAGLNGSNVLTFAKHAGNPNSPTVLATGPTVPDDGQWHYVGIGWDASAGTGSVQVTFKLDGATTTTTVPAFPYADPFAVTIVRGYWRQPISEVLYQSRPDFNEPAWCWDLRNTVNVALDFSTLELDVIPETSRRSVWTWLRRIAAAEQATVAVDETGILRYRTVSRLSAPSAQTPVKVITAERSLLDVALDDSVDAVRNEIVATLKTFTISDTRSPVFTANEVWSIAPYETAHVTVNLAKPAIDLDLSVGVNRPADGAPDPSSTFVCAAFTPTGASTGDPIVESAYGSLTMSLTYFDEKTYDLSLYNFYPRTIYLVTAKPDTPVVSVVGRPIGIGSKDLYSHLKLTAGDLGGYPPIVKRHGLRELKLSENPWMQKEPAAQALLQRLVFDLYRPVAVVRDLAIVGDPRLQLGDRVQIVDRDGLALSADYWIAGIRETYSRSTGYRQQITARRANDTLRWGVGKWGDNTWGEV